MTRATLATCLIFFAVIDVVLPIPILAITLLFVVLRKPAWFLRRVNEVYGPDRP